MNCEYCGAEIKCGHERKVARLKEALKEIVAQDQREKLYPCVKCGELRTKAEGGTTFTLCDKCWDKRYGKVKRRQYDPEEDSFE